MTTAIESTGRISLAEAARLADPDGRHDIGPAHVLEWAARGVGGQKLATVADEQGWWTTAEEVERFKSAIIAQSPNGEEAIEWRDNIPHVLHVGGPLIPVAKVPQYLIAPVHARTVRNWIMKGRDGVKLEALRCFGRTFVSMTALAVFLNAVDGEPAAK